MAKLVVDNSMVGRPILKWLAAAFSLFVLCGLLFYFAMGKHGSVFQVADDSTPASPLFVGEARCAQCHAAEAKAWENSHHYLAMQEANAKTVLGDFQQAHFRGDGMDVRFFQHADKYMIHADGPEGKPTDFEVKYTFGVFPLQQYLLELPGGKLQAFTVAWDSRPQDRGGQRWFNLYPGQKFNHTDELHWTGAQQNWNFMCADCHSTNLQKNYDPKKQIFTTKWSELNVSCEACHGPGSAHVSWADAGRNPAQRGKGLTTSLDERKGVTWDHEANTDQPVRSTARSSEREIEICAQCHSRRAQLAGGYHAGRPFLDYYRPILPTAPFYFADGQQRDEVYTWGSFMQSRMHSKGVTCSDCHEPHSGKLRNSGNDVCTQCHIPAKYDDPKHHFHKIGNKGALCTSCHMPDRTYMVIDNRHDHSFRVPRPDITVAYGDDKAPNACNNCHQDQNAKWAAKWYGGNFRREQHFGAVLSAAVRLENKDAKALNALIDDSTTPAIVRATALQTITRLSGAANIKIASRHTQDINELMRLAAVDAAKAMPPTERANTLLPLLHDTRLAVRLAAVSGLLDFPRTYWTPPQLAVLDAGIAEYRQSQAYNADRAESQANLGQLEMRLGNMKAAAIAYETSIHLNPAFVPAYVNLADIQAAQGRKADAEKTLRNAITITPTSAEAHHALGLLLADNKLLKEALQELQHAYQLQPENARYAYVTAIALHETGDLEGAIKILNSAASRHPADSDIIGALIDYTVQAGDNHTASEYAAKFKGP